MLPMRLKSLGLIVRTRLVPSASGLPAHGSAEAAAQPTNQRTKNTTLRIRPPDRTCAVCPQLEAQNYMVVDISVRQPVFRCAQPCFPTIFPRVGKKQRLPHGTMVSGGDYVHDAKAPPFNLSQEGWQHLGRLRLGVVKQHDAASHP